MSFRQVNDEYDQWRAAQCAVVTADLAYKHKRMGKNAFVFLRATYFRWAGQIEELCPDLRTAPSVLSVGDLHLENFGTWRDAEGRLVWGVNDFDEAWPLPYTNDLVRLATTDPVAPESSHISLSPRRGCEAIMDGYTACLEARGRPMVL